MRIERCLVLSKHTPWYGSATGYYAMLPRALRASRCDLESFEPIAGLLARLAGKCWSWANDLPVRDQTLAFAEMRFLRRFDRAKMPALMLALEDNLPLLTLDRFKLGAPRRLVGVIHYPPELWTRPMLTALGRLRTAVVLYRADIAFFERYVGRGRVVYAPHGVDTDHFTPGESRPTSAPRLLVSGQFGRDFKLLVEVFARVRSAFPECRLDIVGAHHARQLPEVQTLAKLDGVSVLPMQTDGELLGYYRNSTLMVLPLLAAGANNALVEALACGLPIVATDTGGVRDYGGGTIFPVVPKGDAEAFAAAVVDLLKSRGRQQAISAASRMFAEQNLTWPMAARQHIEALAQLPDDEAA